MAINREDMLIKFYQEQTTQARNHENLRVNFVSIILTLGAIVFAVVGWNEGIDSGDIPVLIFVFFIGVFGFLASMKHYERNRMHTRRARAMRELAEQAIGANDIGPALYKARKKHESKNPVMSKRVRLKHVWAAAPLILSAAALLLIFAHLLG